MSSSNLQHEPESSGALRKSVAALSAVQAANYLLPFLSVPYLVRVLGADRFGQIAFAQAFAQYFVVLTDFGFNFSATRSAAIDRDYPAKIEQLYRSITFTKLVLMVSGLLVLIVVIALVPPFRSHAPLLAISYFAVLGSVLFPVWLFQGLEQMGSMAALSLSGRTLSIVGLFAFVHSPSDYLTAAALQASGAPVAGLLAMAMLGRRMSLSIRWLSPRDVVLTLQQGWPFFLSTAAATLYTSSNVFILGLIEPPAAVAYYAAADKVIKASLGVLQPVTQALYPRMSYLFSRDVPSAIEYLKRLSTPFLGFTLLVSLTLCLAANPVASVLFGHDMLPSSGLLRLMSAVPVLVAVSNLLGVQLLFPLGFQSLVSRFQVVAGLASIAALVPMVRSAGATGSALNYVASEAVIMAGFAIIVLRVLKGRLNVRTSSHQ